MNEFELFCDAVHRFWPRYRTTVEELHVPWVDCCSSHKASDVARAFELCKKEFPDAMRPEWERIIRWLRNLRIYKRKLREEYKDRGEDIPVHLSM